MARISIRPHPQSTVSRCSLQSSSCMSVSYCNVRHLDICAVRAAPARAAARIAFPFATPFRIRFSGFRLLFSAGRLRRAMVILRRENVFAVRDNNNKKKNRQQAETTLTRSGHRGQQPKTWSGRSCVRRSVAGFALLVVTILELHGYGVRTEHAGGRCWDNITSSHSSRGSSISQVPIRLAPLALQVCS